MQWPHEVTPPHRTIATMAGVLEAHVAREEAQLCGRQDWLGDRETKWSDRQRDDILWGAGITDMTVKVLAKLRIGGAALTQDERIDDRNQTGRQDGQGLGASQHACAM